MPEGFLAHYSVPQKVPWKVWKGFEVWKNIQRSIIDVLLLRFSGQLLENIDEDKILVLPYMSLKKQLKL